MRFGHGTSTSRAVCRSSRFGAIVAKMLIGRAGIDASIINGMHMSDSPELFGGIVGFSSPKAWMTCADGS